MASPNALVHPSIDNIITKANFRWANRYGDDPQPRVRLSPYPPPASNTSCGVSQQEVWQYRRVEARQRCAARAHPRPVEFRARQYTGVALPHSRAHTAVCTSVADACDRAYDYVVVTTKAIPELLRTPALLAPLLAPASAAAHVQPTYVLFQNGLNVERDLHAAVAALGHAPRIISTAVYISMAMFGANIVRHKTFVRASAPLHIPGLTMGLGPHVAGRVQAGRLYDDDEQ